MNCQGMTNLGIKIERIQAHAMGCVIKVRK